MKSLTTYPKTLRTELGARLYKRRLQKEIRREAQQRLDNGQPLKLIIGAGSGTHLIGSKASKQEGWLLTDQATLNALKLTDWDAVFTRGTIQRIMAEHVVEHWTTSEFSRFLRIVALFLTADGNLRIAVPDGFHPDQEYLDAVKPGGTGPGSDDHKVLYNYQSLTKIITAEKWRYDLLEYFDERHEFHHRLWEPINGFVERSEHNDPRNKERPLAYTSLIIDLHPETELTLSGITSPAVD